MCSVPLFVGIDYHIQTIQVRVINQQGKILANQSVPNEPDTQGTQRNFCIIGGSLLFL